MTRRMSAGGKGPGSEREAVEPGAGSGAATLLRPSGLASDVYEIILGQLMSLKIAPGARITVDALVRELNVSHTPIREALGRLEADGLVVKTHLIGYSAAPQLTRRQFDELYELRLLLEPHAAARAAKAMDRSSLTILADVAASMSRRGTGDERTRYNQFARQDADFHDRIIIGSGNELIRESLARLHTHFHIFRLLFHSRVTEEALEEHAQIMKALKSGDGEGAAAAMRRHIERSRDRLLPTFD
ncbi:MAG: GntR family transcriptional regulator [Dongiaceae bacterium]